MLESDPSTRLQWLWTSNSNLTYASAVGEGGGKKDIAQGFYIFSSELQLVFDVPDTEATADLGRGERCYQLAVGQTFVLAYDSHQEVSPSFRTYSNTCPSSLRQQREGTNRRADMANSTNLRQLPQK